MEIISLFSRRLVADAGTFGPLLSAHAAFVDQAMNSLVYESVLQALQCLLAAEGLAFRDPSAIADAGIAVHERHLTYSQAERVARGLIEARERRLRPCATGPELERVLAEAIKSGFAGQFWLDISTALKRAGLVLVEMS